ncbi:hypothetical protein [Yersinia pestis]|nr:hypothetical protein [Yersinia pestis]
MLKWHKRWIPRKAHPDGSKGYWIRQQYTNTVSSNTLDSANTYTNNKAD